MNLEDIEKFIKSLFTKPKKTIILFLLLCITLIIIAWLNGFFNEKGKQFASPENDFIDTLITKTDEDLSEKTTSIEPSIRIGDIKENTNTQININSPHSTQIVNQSRSIKEVFFKKEIKGELYRLIITFIQTEGVWSVGTKFRIQVFLSGPYKEYRFTQGLPTVQMMVIIRDDKEKGIIDYSTESAILNEPVILEIESVSDLNITSIYVEPYFQ
jgi:hypothetical protein